MKYFGKILNLYDIVNKKYVDDLVNTKKLKVEDDSNGNVAFNNIEWQTITANDDGDGNVYIQLGIKGGE